VSLLGSLTNAGAGKGTRRTRSTTAKRGSAPAATKGGSPSGRHGKFNAKGEHVNGVWMASEAQAERYRQLLRMEMDGTIGGLRTEVPFDLVVNNKKICTYRADFVYAVLDERGERRREVVEDVKGMITPEFRLKAKLFAALMPWPISLVEVKGKLVPVDGEGNRIKGAAASSAAWMHREWAGRIPQ
jgi:hypothetical protein